MKQPAALLLGVLIVSMEAAPAQAQSWFSPWGSSWERGRGWDRGWDRDRWPRRGYRDRDYRERRESRSAPRDANRDAIPSGPVTAIVSLRDQSIEVYGGDTLLARSRVSTGSRGYRTPTGVFSVIQKNRYHESNIYSGAPMPWMQRITWSGIALHGGVVPGYPASHGCIRLTYDFAPRLWAMTRLGARVIVSPREISPKPIVHAGLPVPAVTPAGLEGVAGRQGVTPVVAEAASDERTEAKTDGPKITGALSASADPLETPLQRARAARARAAADAKAAEATLKSAVAVARRTSTEAQQAKAAVHKARARVSLAERKLAAASRAASGASTDEEEEATETEKAAREELEAAEKALEDARGTEALQAQAASEAADAARAAVDARDRATEAVRSLTRSTDPITIFVSRKEGRVFLRQGFAPLLDGAVSIRDSDRSLGTHVFTAIGEEEGGARLRWSVVTVPDDGVTGNPAEALDRVDFSSQIGKEIANRLWTGATLIISDQGISNETGKGTDFVVLTRP